MPIVIGILTFISRIYTHLNVLREDLYFSLYVLSFIEQLKFHAQLS